jgi:hypothetical protein
MENTITKRVNRQISGVSTTEWILLSLKLAVINKQLQFKQM